MHDGSADEEEGSGVYAIGGRAGGSSLCLDGGLGAFEPAAGNKSNMKVHGGRKDESCEGSLRNAENAGAGHCGQQWVNATSRKESVLGSLCGT